MAWCMHPFCKHALGFAVTPPNISKAPSHGPTATPGSQRCSLWKWRKDKQIKSEWVVWLCFEGTEPEMQRECGEDTRWRRSLQENGHRKKEEERFGRSKIIVTLSLDSIHYFYIQWAQCWGDMAEIHLKYIWQREERWSGGFTVPYSISIIFNSCHHKSQCAVHWINPTPYL